MKETTRATYARAYTRPYQKTGTGKLKLNGNLYGTGCSVHRPFNYRSPPVFFKRAPVVRIERGNFFLTPTVSHTSHTSHTSHITHLTHHTHNTYITHLTHLTHIAHITYGRHKKKSSSVLSVQRAPSSIRTTGARLKDPVANRY